MRETIHYYVSGHTAKGYVDLLESNLKGITNVIVLQGVSWHMKTDVLKEAIREFRGKYPIEIIHSLYGEIYIEAIIIRKLDVAIITDTISEKLLIKTTDISIPVQVKQDINKYVYKENIHELTMASYENFSLGLSIHDDLEALYISKMNFSKADQVAAHLVREIFSSAKKQNTKSSEYHRLFGSNTFSGVVNVVPQLIGEIRHRYFLKGRAGTGKSSLQKQVIKKGRQLGCDMEIYHCSFDPDSIDMVLIPELDTVVFDSTDPHAFFPNHSNDIVIDMYKETVEKGTDEKYAEKIEQLHTNYKYYMKKGIECLEKAAKWHDEREDKYFYKQEDIAGIVQQIENYI